MKLIPRHTEVEYKWFADHLDWKAFVSQIRNKFNKQIIQEVKVSGPDTYFANGKHFIRYRSNTYGFKELTTKRKTTGKNNIVREEVDIPLEKLVPENDIFKFLQLAGFNKKFTIIKKCHIFSIGSKNRFATLVIYDISIVGSKRKNMRFVEVEGLKSQSLSVNKKFIMDWKLELEANFGLKAKDLSSKSLYEIVSEYV